MKFVPPLLILLFATTLLGVWVLDTKRKHMLLFGLSFAAFTCGLLVQIMQIFSRLDVTSLVTTSFYLSACYLFCKAVMLRLGKTFPPVVGGFVSTITLVLIGYMAQAGLNYSYIATAASLGLGSMLTILCLKLEKTSEDWLERIFNGVLIIFAAHFILRGIFTIDMLKSVLSTQDLIQSEYWMIATVFLSFSGVLLGLLILVVSTADVIKELQDERDADPLTGMLNRRGLERRVNYKINAINCGYQAVIIADIDYFKRVNDDLGHAVGDQLLVEFTKLLQSTAGSSSIISRIGGEEFLILVKGSPEQCEMLGNRLCNKVARHNFSVLPSGRKITSSFGIAMLRKDENLWDTVRRADSALMQVKRRGRNRVCVEGHEFPHTLHPGYLLTA